MTPEHEAALTGGGDCFAHWHSEDRRPTHDFLRGLQSLAVTKSSSSSVTLTGGEDIVRVDTSAGDVTVTLPPPVNGEEVTVIKTSALNTLTIIGSINGAVSKSYTTQWSSRTFKAIDGQWSIISGFIRDKFPHGAFTSTQTQSVAAAATPTRVTFNLTDYSRLVEQIAGDGIHVYQSGLYNLQFSMQLTNADVQIHDAAVWLRKGSGLGAATDVPNTASVVSVAETHGGISGHHVLAANFPVYLDVDDYVELWWAASSTSVQLETLPAITTPFASPASPSVVLTLTYVSSETS